MRPMEEVLRRADAYFAHESDVHHAARELTRRLDNLSIPYVLIGALAVNHHGLVRMTENVDVVLTREGLDEYEAKWPRVDGRLVVAGVHVRVLVAGTFPGDRKPKPVAFPDPASVPDERAEDGWRVIGLRGLLELKMASGMTAPHRMRDIDDSIRVIRANDLPEQYEIDPYVREKYRELWALAQIRDEE